MSDVINVRDVSQRFGSHIVYHDISFTVGAGEVFAILGGSGSGKSTLMRQMIGLLPPADGTVEILGHDMYAAQADVLTHIGVMYQSGALFGSMTLLENVMLPLQMHSTLPPAACREIARVKLGLVSLGHAAELMPAEISGGMAKRAAIARAMALDPAIVFLDEPSAGLDPITSADLDDLILNLRKEMGITFVLVTHELPSILAVADRCIMLDSAAKCVIAEGDPRKLRDQSSNPTVRAFFRREVMPAPVGAAA
jgi:phospholipid/cholesterol/gamma-HCH transport system ATP-binding protein